MGGRPPSNREVDRVNKRWLDNKVGYMYRHTTTGTDLRPETVTGIQFIRVPFPGKNQTVWGFETVEELHEFKRKYVNV